jgi:AmmeMemoRadiSam system protein A
MELSDKERRILLDAARGSIRSLFEKPPQQKLNNLSEPLKQKSGAFVTLKIKNELRGCIGYLFPETNLYETVINAARQSASCDPRFYPLAPEEFESIEIEISVLSGFTQIDSYDEIKIGIHGLFLEMENLRAVLLPQVAEKNNFTVPQFLTAICEKAGLPSFFWQIKKLNLNVFEADVFSENRIKLYENL